MKERQAQPNQIDRDFRHSLFMWQVDPDSPLAAARLNETLTKACEAKRGLTFKVKREILSTTESRNAISIADLKRYAKAQGDFYVFNLYPKRDKVGHLRVGVKDLLRGAENRGIIDKYNFVFEERNGDIWRTVGIFRPYELESFTLR